MEKQQEIKTRNAVRRKQMKIQKEKILCEKKKNFFKSINLRNENFVVWFLITVSFPFKFQV